MNERLGSSSQKCGNIFQGNYLIVAKIVYFLIDFLRRCLRGRDDRKYIKMVWMPELQNCKIEELLEPKFDQKSFTSNFGSAFGTATPFWILNQE